MAEISAGTLSERLGISRRLVVAWCRDGRVIGAYFHPTVRRWLIPTPVKCKPSRERLINR